MLTWLKNKLSKRAITYQQGFNAGLFPTGGNWTGIPITEQNALGVSALWCGIKVISEAVGSLTPLLYQRTPQGRDEARSHPLYRLLESEPNPEVTRPVLWEVAQAHALLYGNAFMEVERDNAGRPIALWNIHPTHVRVGRDSNTAKLVYYVNLSTTGGPPGNPGEVRVLDAEDVLHVPGLSPDGSVGYRLLTIAQQTLGFGLAAQRYGCSLFRNLGRPGGVINSPANIKHDDAAYQNIKRSFTQETGAENTGSVILMEQGYTFTPLTFSTNEQVQYKELLEFFVFEVARLLNIPPTKLHSLSQATWANLTELNRDFLTTTLRPWLEKWECEAEKKLLMPSEKGRYFIEFNEDALLRLDQTERYQNYATALSSGFMTVNEIRAEENRLPLPGGDDLPNAEKDQGEKPDQPGDINDQQPDQHQGDDIEDQGDE